MALAIDQDPQNQARLAIELALDHLGVTERQWPRLPRHGTLPFTIHSPANT
jgi:LacI family transcriptional regulator